MDTQNIRAFLMVTETGSFSRAAEKLFITQPAVSKRIATLEQSLHTILFDRIGKQVQLTEAGQALVPGYRRILAEMEESRRILSHLSQQTGGTLSLATSHHIGLYRLPEVLKEYTRRYRDVELDIHFMESEQAMPKLQHGDIELALVTLPDAPERHLRHIEVWSDPMHCVVAKRHALAKQARVSLKQLLQTPAILPASGTHTRELVDAALGHQLPQKIILQTSYLETIKAMVQAGLGWSLLPDSMIDKNMVPLKLRQLTIARHLGVVLHDKRTLSSAASRLLDLLGISPV
jgi:DNA-binding transcriptional LysR family regulator